MNFNRKIVIGDREISDTSTVFIIAEAGVNHGGDMNIARRLIDLAVEAKVDAVKFQTFKAAKLILPTVGKAPYQQLTTDKSESQHDMLKKLEVSQEQNLELKKYCQSKEILFLTTPFDEDSLDELDSLDLPAIKISSTDVTNLPFLRKVAKKNVPIILSCGMTYLEEVEIALREIHAHNKDVILLQCTANYPIADNEANLAVIRTLQKKFDMLVGYSDHSNGVGAAPYAVPMGAKVLEKHFTLDNNMEGPDHKASLSPAELIQFVKDVRRVESYMGTSLRMPSMSELKTRVSLQKSLVSLNTIKVGDLFSEENIIAMRTGGKGISPIYYHQVLGKKAHRDFASGEIIEI
jgi:N,N'-diacetyllegionaminate synthase